VTGEREFKRTKGLREQTSKTSGPTERVSTGKQASLADHERPAQTRGDNKATTRTTNGAGRQAHQEAGPGSTKRQRAGTKQKAYAKDNRQQPTTKADKESTHGKQGNSLGSRGQAKKAPASKQKADEEHKHKRRGQEASRRQKREAV
jgi:hypothetical protein